MRKIFLTILIFTKITSSIWAQKGMLFEYKVSMTGQAETIYLFKVISLSGNSISELKDLKSTNYPNTTLRLKSDPGFGYHLNQNKTYFKMEDRQLPDYRIKILGKETVNGFHCVKIAVYTHTGGGYSIMWISNEISHYRKYLTADINNCNLTKLNSALKKIKSSGFPVRITDTEGTGLQFDFVKVTYVDTEKSIFSLDSYQELKLQPMTNNEIQKMFATPETAMDFKVSVFNKAKNEPIPYSSIRIYQNEKLKETYQTDGKGYLNFWLNYENTEIKIEAINLGYQAKDTILSMKAGNFNIKIYLETIIGKINSEGK